MNMIKGIAAIQVNEEDMVRVLKAINDLPEQDRGDITARAICMIKIFNEEHPRRDVGTLTTAIDVRFREMSKLLEKKEFSPWVLPNSVSSPMLRAAAKERLHEVNGDLEFDFAGFLKRVIAISEQHGEG